MLTQISTYLFGGRRMKAAIDAAIASAIEDARESGSLAVPEQIEVLERGTRVRLLALVRQAPKDIEVATEVLRAQIATLQDELTELNGVAQRAEALGLLASRLVRWAVAGRTRRTVREVVRLRAQVLRYERTQNQLEQWLDTRVQMISAEYRRARCRADHAARLAGALQGVEVSVPVARSMSLASVN